MSIESDSKPNLRVFVVGKIRFPIITRLVCEYFQVEISRRLPFDIIKYSIPPFISSVILKELALEDCRYLIIDSNID